MQFTAFIDRLKGWKMKKITTTILFETTEVLRGISLDADDRKH